MATPDRVPQYIAVTQAAILAREADTQGRADLTAATNIWLQNRHSTLNMGYATQIGIIDSALHAVQMAPFLNASTVLTYGVMYAAATLTAHDISPLSLADYTGNVFLPDEPTIQPDTSSIDITRVRLIEDIVSENIVGDPFIQRHIKEQPEWEKVYRTEGRRVFRQIIQTYVPELPSWPSGLQ